MTPCCPANACGSLPPAPALPPLPRCCANRRLMRITTRSSSPTPAAKWAELEYGRQLIDNIRQDELLAELMGEGFRRQDPLLPDHNPGRQSQDGPHHRACLKDGTVFDRSGDRGRHQGGYGFAQWSAVRWPSTTTSKRFSKVSACAKVQIPSPKEFVVEKAFVG